MLEKTIVNSSHAAKQFSSVSYSQTRFAYQCIIGLSRGAEGSRKLLRYTSTYFPLKRSNHTYHNNTHFMCTASQKTPLSFILFAPRVSA